MKYLYDDKTIRVWVARMEDYDFILSICKKYRDFQFFYVPDETLKYEIRKGNIIAFDYNVFEAGYIWVTFPRNGRSRINQLAVDEELWRNKVGTVVVDVFEALAKECNMWSIYLSCNTNTMGDKFWPKVGYNVVCQKAGKHRKGMNIIWGKLLKASDEFLFSPDVKDIKSIDSYINQSSISVSTARKKIKIKTKDKQISLFV